MGLTAEGLSTPRLADLIERFRTDAIAIYGADYNALAGGTLQLTAEVVLARLADSNEALQATYDNLNRDVAEGVYLNYLGAFVGVDRLDATKSTAVVTFTGTIGTVIPAGTIVRVEATDVRFITVEDATIGAGGTIDVDVECEEVGANSALADTITDIVTPVAGVDSVNNEDDATIGRDEESDADYRLRIEQSLQNPGAGTEGSIRAGLLAVDGVQTALVASNRTSTTDADGIPPKAVYCIIYPSTVNAVAIANVIYNKIPAGIESHGSQTATITDTQGYVQEVAWDWAEEVELYLEVTVDTNNKFPANGEDQVLAAVLATGNAFQVGEDILAIKFIQAVRDITGIVDMSVKIDDVDPPATSINTNYAIDLNQIGVFSSSRITINIT